MHHPPLTLRCKETRKTLPAVVETVDQDHQAGIASTVSKSVKRSSLLRSEAVGFYKGARQFTKHPVPFKFCFLSKLSKFDFTFLGSILHRIQFQPEVASV